MSNRVKSVVLAIVIILGVSSLRAQQAELPLDEQLQQNSQKWLIKIGMITGKKPPKLKFGEFSTIDRSGATGSDFTISLSNNSKDSVFIKGVNEKETGKNLDDISVYINTSLDTEELWILMMTRPAKTKEISLESIIMTDGFSEMTFEKIMAEPKGGIEETAAKGIQMLMDGMPIAAMQYDSGATFSYKKYIWISDRMSPQTQIVAAGVFSAILEIGEYFSDIVVVE